jgi:hypothetical protein
MKRMQVNLMPESTVPQMPTSSTAKIVMIQHLAEKHPQMLALLLIVKDFNVVFQFCKLFQFDTQLPRPEGRSF